MSLLVHRRKIAADATKRGSSGVAAKRSGDLLLNFHHPKIPLREIVRKGQRQVVEKGKHLICPSQQVIEQVPGGTLLLPPAPFDRLCLDRRRLGRIATHQDFEIVRDPLVPSPVLPRVWRTSLVLRTVPSSVELVLLLPSCP